MSKTKKVFLIDKLINENWFENEKEALPWILSGKVLVNDQKISSGKEKIPVDGIIRIKEYYKKRYVNKGGLKLEGALSDFGLDISGKIALDCGASTGGFTDCLLQHGAKLVYAVDSGNGQLAGKLLINKNVINLERTNLMDGSLKELSPKPDIITLDLNNMSLRQGVLICKDILKSNGIIIALIKPIYEVESPEIRRTGNINQFDVLKNIICGLCGYFIENGFDIMGITNSPVRGNADTLEYFVYLDYGRETLNNINKSYQCFVDQITERSFSVKKFQKNNFV